MKNIKNRCRHLFYLSIISILTVSLNGCFTDDKEETGDRHIPGVYTGTYNGSPTTIVVGEDSVTRLVITVGTPATLIDITGSWPLTWNNDDYCYDFVIITSTGTEAVIIDGVAGIDADDIATVQCSVKVDGADEGAFYLYL
jgi:hypothetical protein